MVKTKSEYSSFIGIKEIDDKYIDYKYYYFHKFISITRKIFHIRLKVGDFYNSHGLVEDTERHAVDLIETEKHPELIKRQREKDKEIGNKLFPPKCNRITSAPCSWSYSHWSTDRCRKCGHVFPEWN